MTGEYGLRLVCLCLASYFVVQLVVGLVLRGMAPWTFRVVSDVAPRVSARILLILRFAPAISGLFVVAAICIPSYIWFEPRESAEEIGFVCLAAAMFGLAVWLVAIVGGSRQLVRSRRRIREFGTTASPVVAIVGILRTRLLVSPAVVEALDREQLDAALRHERAHGAAHDNLKRLLFAFTPGLLPGWNGFETVERQWARFSEWAADDDAVKGDAERAVALASALVCVARLGTAPVPLASSMLDGSDLAERVDRLLAAKPVPRHDGGAEMLEMMVVLGAALATGIAARPGTLESAHRLLERLL